VRYIFIYNGTIGKILENLQLLFQKHLNLFGLKEGMLAGFYPIVVIQEHARQY
jgi:hypothetical protein